MDFRFFEGLPPEDLLARALALHERVLGMDRDEVRREAASQRGITFALAIDEGEVVGYKAGYERKPAHYYSWLGGVDETYRRRGIARRLMQMQHAWCVAHDYVVVRTISTNRNRAMLIFNVREGFDVIGLMTSEIGPKIVFEKRLGPERVDGSRAGS
jgi:ribosomal protein S18 acetylase RimI-like enzyme